jgi:hypothetical protein
VEAVEGSSAGIPLQANNPIKIVNVDLILRGRSGYLLIEDT